MSSDQNPDFLSSKQTLMTSSTFHPSSAARKKRLSSLIGKKIREIYNGPTAHLNKAQGHNTGCICTICTTQMIEESKKDPLKLKTKEQVKKEQLIKLCSDE